MVVTFVCMIRVSVRPTCVRVSRLPRFLFTGNKPAPRWHPRFRSKVVFPLDCETAICQLQSVLPRARRSPKQMP